MSETTKPYNEIDDYIAAFSDEERQEPEVSSSQERKAARLEYRAAFL